MALFLISRTSQGYPHLDDDNPIPPLEGAYLGEAFIPDIRTVDDPSKLLSRYKNTWYFEGLNHRVVNGCIVRDFPEKVWLLGTINSLSDLLSLLDREGQVVIHPANTKYNLPCIEIYDDYRE